MTGRADAGPDSGPNTGLDADLAAGLAAGLEARLVDSGLSESAAPRFARDVLEVAAGSPAALDDAAGLAAALWRFLGDGDLARAVTLRDLGATIPQVEALAEHSGLGQVMAALDQGVPLDVLELAAARGRNAPGTLVRLVKAGAPRAVLECAADAQMPSWGAHALALASAGLSWEDVLEVAATRPVTPISRVAGGVQLLASSSPLAAALPARVLVLAAELAALSEGSVFDCVPAAAAIAGQPWEGTLRVLLADAAVDPEPGEVFSIVLAARQLHDDVSLPTGRAPGPPFAPPPVLSGRLPAGTPARVPAAPPPSVVDLALAAGVSDEVARELEQWLGIEAAWGVDVGQLAERRVPSRGVWGLRFGDVLAAALMAGVSVDDLQASMLVPVPRGARVPVDSSHGRAAWSAPSLGCDGVLALACGSSLADLQSWSARDADAGLTAVLVAFGVPSELALVWGVHAVRGWHAVHLLAAGVDVSTVEQVLPVFTGRPADRPYADLDGLVGSLPVPVEVLSLLAGAGRVLDGAPSAWFVDRPGSRAVPFEAACLAVSASLSVVRWSSNALVLAVAAAGQPWLAACPVPAPVRHADPSAREQASVQFASQVSKARGLGVSGRDVSAVAQAAPGSTGSAAEVTAEVTAEVATEVTAAALPRVVVAGGAAGRPAGSRSV
jgi:hypothetical protein